MLQIVLVREIQANHFFFLTFLFLKDGIKDSNSWLNPNARKK